MKYTEPSMEMIILITSDVIRTSDNLNVYPDGDDQNGSWGELQ